MSLVVSLQRPSRKPTTQHSRPTNDRRDKLTAMAEVIGGAFGMTVSILQILDRVSTIKRSVRSAYDAGLFAPRGASTKALLEFFVFREASAVVEQIEASVLQAEDSEVKAFIKAYSHSFNMIGIAVSEARMRKLVLVANGSRVQLLPKLQSPQYHSRVSVTPIGRPRQASSSAWFAGYFRSFSRVS